MPDLFKDPEKLFLAALERATPQDRAEFVEAACAGQPELLRRLRDLLASHDESRGPLDAPPAGVRVNAVSPGPTRTEGTIPMGEALDQLAAGAPAGRPGQPEFGMCSTRIRPGYSAARSSSGCVPAGHSAVPAGRGGSCQAFSRARRSSS